MELCLIQGSPAAGAGLLPGAGASSPDAGDNAFEIYMQPPADAVAPTAQRSQIGLDLSYAAEGAHGLGLGTQIVENALAALCAPTDRPGDGGPLEAGPGAEPCEAGLKGGIGAIVLSCALPAPSAEPAAEIDDPALRLPDEAGAGTLRPAEEPAAGERSSAALRASASSMEPAIRFAAVAPPPTLVEPPAALPAAAGLTAAVAGAPQPGAGTVAFGGGRVSRGSDVAEPRVAAEPLADRPTNAAAALLEVQADTDPKPEPAPREARVPPALHGGPAAAPAPVAAGPAEPPAPVPASVAPTSSWADPMAIPGSGHATRTSDIVPARSGAASAHAASEQVALQVAKSLIEGRTEIRVHLKPPELGQLDIRLEFSELRLVATITAERPETLDLLQRDARVLCRAFREAGVELADSDLAFAQGGRDDRSAGEETRAPPLTDQVPEGFDSLTPALASSAYERSSWLTEGRLDVRA